MTLLPHAVLLLKSGICLIFRDASRLTVYAVVNLKGFIYISSVDEGEDTPSACSGLSHLYGEATNSGRLLVISRISNQKVLPWSVSSTGAIRCYDTVSLSHKLSLHRRAQVPVVVHLFSWNEELEVGSSSSLPRSLSHPLDDSKPDVSLVPEEEEEEDSEVLQVIPGLHRDDEAEISFRFHKFSLPDSW